MAYYGKRVKSWKDYHRRFFYEWLLQRFVGKDRTLLDIGVGSGMFYNIARKKGYKVNGIDNDPNCCKGNIKCISALEINESYDVFFNAHVLEHIDAMKFMEIAKKHCKILITINSVGKNFWNNPQHIRPYPRKAIERLYDHYGFKVIWSKHLFPTASYMVVGENLGFKEDIK